MTMSLKPTSLRRCCARPFHVVVNLLSPVSDSSTYQTRQFYRGSFSTHLDLPHGLLVLRIPTRRSRSGRRGPYRTRALPSKKTPPIDHSKDLAVEENIEIDPILGTNGAAVSTSSSSRAGALNALMRKYLLVDAIVMGQCTSAL